MTRATEADAVLSTDAGSWLLWQPEAFAHVHDYDTWATELYEATDMLRHVRSGVAVPISIDSDGASGFRVRVGRTRGRLRGPKPVELTARERRHLVLSSDPYLLVSHGRVVASGIEHVGPADPERHLALDLPAGRWAVTAHLIQWDAEPGATDENDGPTADALPDFVLLLNPEEDPTPPYRQSLATFD